MMVANVVHEREYLDRLQGQRHDTPHHTVPFSAYPKNSTLTCDRLNATMELHPDDVAESG